MKKLFIHQPFFRILSPIFSGVIVYLLVLLLNNNVEQLQEQFLSEDLYFCIGLSYVIQEFSRFLLILFKKFPKGKSTALNLLVQVLVSLGASIGIVTLIVTIYFKYVIGFSATTEDIVTLDSIFAVITFIYILLFVSHEYLYKVNSEKLQHEQVIKQNIEDDFRQFKRGINPHLLFESLEALIVLMHQDQDTADEFIDHLSTIYRYILTSKDRQLVSIQEELKHVLELEELFNKLPYRSLRLTNNIKGDFLTVPGSLLFFIELIVRKSIMSSKIELEISIKEETKNIVIEYDTHDKINSVFKSEDLLEIFRVYSVYSEDAIQIESTGQKRIIHIPKLTIKS